jgi:hypothetical protein
MLVLTLTCSTSPRPTIESRLPTIGLHPEETLDTRCLGRKHTEAGSFLSLRKIQGDDLPPDDQRPRATQLSRRLPHYPPPLPSTPESFLSNTPLMPPTVSG